MSVECRTAAILAGGKGTRLRPLTEKLPKAMVEVAGEPFIFHELRLLAHHGISHVLIGIGYLGETIRQTVGSGARFGLKIDYFTGAELGSGGILRNSLPLFHEPFLFLIYGDCYLECDYQAAAANFQKSGKQALMTVYRNENRLIPSNVEFDGTSILRYDKKTRTEKMEYIDYGLGLFRRGVFEKMPQRPIELSEIYQDLLRQNQLAAYEVKDGFFEIGSFEGLETARQHLNKAGIQPKRGGG